MRLLTRAFVDYVIEQVKRGPDISGPRNSALPWWGRWDLNPRPLAPISRSHQRPRFTVQDWTLVSSGRGQNPLDQARRRPLSSESNRAAFLCYARTLLAYELGSQLADEELLRGIT